MLLQQSQRIEYVDPLYRDKDSKVVNVTKKQVCQSFDDDVDKSISENVASQQTTSTTLTKKAVNLPIEPKMKRN